MGWGKIPLNNEQRIPALAFGTGTIWKRPSPTDPGPTNQIIQALQEGFAHIDTAQAYGTEPHVGMALKELKDGTRPPWVTTKYWKPSPRAAEGVKGALLRSLELLGLDAVDLYLIHNPKGIEGQLKETWTEFEDCLEAGLTRSIGVSNFTKVNLEDIMQTARIVPAINQISLNPYLLAASQPTLDYCRAHGIVIEAYSPLAPITQHPGGPVDEPVQKAALRRGATPAQILLSWVRAKGCVVVTTTSKRERLREYIDTINYAPLTPEEIKAIDDAGLLGTPSYS